MLGFETIDSNESAPVRFVIIRKWDSCIVRLVSSSLASEPKYHLWSFLQKPEALSWLLTDEFRGQVFEALKALEAELELIKARDDSDIGRDFRFNQIKSWYDQRERCASLPPIESVTPYDLGPLEEE